MDEDNLDVSEEVDNSYEEPTFESDTDEPSAEDSYDEEPSYEDNSEDVPEKFRSDEALSKSYAELERKLSALGEENAKLRRDMELASLSPEERRVAEQNKKFIKQNELLTKAEFLQMQKDQHEASELRNKGASERQVERVKEVSTMEKYSKMTLSEIFMDLYGGIPRTKPTQGVRSKPKERIVKSNTISRQKIKDMAWEDYQKIESDIATGKIEIID